MLRNVRLSLDSNLPPNINLIELNDEKMNAVIIHEVWINFMNRLKITLLNEARKRSKYEDLLWRKKSLKRKKHFKQWGKEKWCKQYLKL